MPRRIIYGVHRRSDTMGVSFTAYASIPMTLRIVYGVRQCSDAMEGSFAAYADAPMSSTGNAYGSHSPGEP